MTNTPWLRRVARMTNGLLAAAVLAASLMAAAWAYHWSLQAGYDDLQARALPQLDLYAAGLESELRRHEYVPGLVELDASVIALLTGRGDTLAAREKASASFARLATTTGAASIFLLDPAGVCIAASDGYQPGSLAGRDLSGRPLYADVMQSGKAGSFSSNGSSDTGGADYYFAQLIRGAGQVLGIAVARVSLERLETTWIEDAARTQSDKLLVIDENEVIIMSSVPGWKYRAMANLSLEARERLRSLGRYPDQVGVFQPINATLDQVLDNGATVVRLPFHGNASPLVRYITHERPRVRPGWRLVLFSDASAVRVSALKTAAVAGGAVALLGVLGLYLLQYRRDAAARQAAREMLQQAHDDLGRRVEERTLDLRLINKELVREIQEREKAEAVLRTAQDELVQAGKMALLGQMAAGMAHEINQPLMAMRALSDNARLLLERGRLADAGTNLQSIAELTERMGRITAQLRSFSRKAPAVGALARLDICVSNALSLLASRVRQERAAISVDVAPTLQAQCDANRLEQVLLNLVGNALDAMKDWPGTKAVSISASLSDGSIAMRVADSGPGIAPEVRDRLFEPFFSTKPTGEGLGLGLVISANIVREFGGTLRTVPSPVGATFEFDLKPGPERQHV